MIFKTFSLTLILNTLAEENFGGVEKNFPAFHIEILETMKI